MKRGDCRAVENISFNIEKGDSVGLVGESGCGKSTVAYSILRMLPFPGEIVGGNIYLDNIDLGSLSEEEMRHYRWSKIAMVFQGAMNALNPIIRVKEQITEAIRMHDPNISKNEARDVTFVF